MVDVAIIGCGVVGAAAAMQLARRQCSVLVLEAENDVAMGTTKANSAILHAGYDPEPGTLMAKLNLRGSQLAAEICEQLDVPRRQCGSMVLAFSNEEMEHLHILLERGQKNGVPGLYIASGEEVRKMEPALSGEVQGALVAPSAAIVSPWELALAMAENAVQNGAQLLLETPVTGLSQIEGGWQIDTPRGSYTARFVLNAAGVNADKIHNLAAAPTFTTCPNRGEYYLLDKSEGNTVHHVIFQCPTKAGKGVLVAPTVHGNLIVGPNAEELPSPSTSNTADGLAFVAAAARKSVPGLQLGASIRNFAGVRANTNRDDFVIEWAAPGLLDLGGMKSPGLTAATAVGEYALQLLDQAGLSAPAKQQIVSTRQRVRFAHLSDAEKRELVQKEPLYGRIVCRCETVTEGEIVAACHSSIPPRSIDGIKRRVGAGMGRCQGGFCGPRVMEILCRECGLSPLEVPQDQAGSYLLAAQTKQEGGKQ